MQITALLLSILIVRLAYRFFRRYQVSKRKNADFSQQLQIFKNLGFVLNQGVTTGDVVNSWGIEAYNKDPFSLLYIDLGSTIEKEPWTPITDQVWHFDTEAIENPGDYVKILQNLQRVSRGEVIFNNVSDVVDFENEKASISFELNGDKYHYDLEFKDDWVDPTLFTKIVELTKKYNTKGRFSYFDTKGQDLVIGFLTTKELNKLRSKTGLNVVWLG